MYLVLNKKMAAEAITRKLPPLSTYFQFDDERGAPAVLGSRFGVTGIYYVTLIEVLGV